MQHLILNQYNGRRTRSRPPSQWPPEGASQPWVGVRAALPDWCGEATVAGSCQVAPAGRNLTHGGHHAAGVAVLPPPNRSGFMSNIQSRHRLQFPVGRRARHASASPGGEVKLVISAHALSTGQYTIEFSEIANWLPLESQIVIYC